MFVLTEMRLSNASFKVPGIREILRSLPNAKREWNTKNPMEKYCYFYSIGKIPFNWLRIPLFSADLTHVHWFAYFMFTYLISLSSLSVYTIIYYAIRGQLLTGLISTCMAGITLGVRKKNKQRVIHYYLL